MSAVSGKTNSRINHRIATIADICSLEDLCVGDTVNIDEPTLEFVLSERNGSFYCLISHFPALASREVLKKEEPFITKLHEEMVEKAKSDPTVNNLLLVALLTVLSVIIRQAIASLRSESQRR